MHRISRFLIIALLAFPVYTVPVHTLPVFAATDDDLPENPDFRTVPVSSVPAKILKVARDAKPGVYLMQATEILGPDDDTYYEFDGSLVGTYWTITVRADGKLIEVSQEGEAPNLD